MTRTRGGTKALPFLVAFAGIVLSAFEYPLNGGPTGNPAPARTRFPAFPAFTAFKAFTVRRGPPPTVVADRAGGYSVLPVAGPTSRPSPKRSTRTVSPSLISPERISLARRSPMAVWTRRRSGRAP